MGRKVIQLSNLKSVKPWIVTPCKIKQKRTHWPTAPKFSDVSARFALCVVGQGSESGPCGEHGVADHVGEAGCRSNRGGPGQD